MQDAPKSETTGARGNAASRLFVPMMAALIAALAVILLASFTATAATADPAQGAPAPAAPELDALPDVSCLQPRT